MFYLLNAFFKAIYKMGKILFRILRDGIKTVFKSRKKAIILIAGTIFLYGIRLVMRKLYGVPPNLAVELICWDGWVLYPLTYVFLFNGGIPQKMNHYFTAKKYRRIFQRINFLSIDKFYPGYVGTTITENMKIITFYSTIPVNIWIHKQSLLENAFNARFYEIKDRPDNNRIIDVFILTEELPSVIPWSDAYILGVDTLFIGEGYHGRVGMNLETQPHAFIAGETGSGKSIILQCMIYQALKKGYKVALIDFKRGVSFSCFSGLVDMVVELEQADKLLSGLIAEVNQRLDLFVAEGVQDIKGYNKKMAQIGGKRMQRIIVVVDELAELVDIGGADKEEKALIQSVNRSLRTLARIARAAGIHLLLGVQRPDSNIIDGQIKSNIPFRVCGRFTDPQPSIIVLGNSNATQLPNIAGRFIADGQEIQAYYFQAEQVKNLLAVTTAEPKYVPPAPMKQERKQADVPIVKPSKNGLDLDFSEIDL